MKVKTEHLSKEGGFLQPTGKMLEGFTWANASGFMVSREQALRLQQVPQGDKTSAPRSAPSSSVLR